MSSLLKARIAGVFYLITFVAGFLALLSARGRVVGELMSTAAYVVVTLLFYQLFKPVNKSLSLLAASFSLAGCVLTVLNRFHLTPFDINPLAVFGCYCLLIGYLIYRSTFLPGVLGALMAFGGLSWLTFASPQLAKSLSPFNFAPGILAEGLLTLWLLVMGVNEQRWREQASAAFRTDQLKETKMKIIVLCAFLLCLLIPIASAVAQENPLSKTNKAFYAAEKKILLRSAEMVSEENYSFKPTDTVRTFGQVVAHVADAQYAFCSIALGEKNPGLKVEKTKTSKADLIAALKDAFAYCDKAYDGMTDASATEKVKFMGGDTPKLGVLTVNNMHNMEHYGNLVTYMRIRNIVPPTSDPEFMKQLTPAQ